MGARAPHPLRPETGSLACPSCNYLELVDQNSEPHCDSAHLLYLILPDKLQDSTADWIPNAV